MKFTANLFDHGDTPVVSLLIEASDKENAEEQALYLKHKLGFDVAYIHPDEPL